MPRNSTDDERGGTERDPPVRRRTFLAGTGLVGTTALTGFGLATAQNGTGETGESTGESPAPAATDGSITAGFDRHELSEDGLGNAQTDTPPFCPRLKTYEGRQYYAYWTHAGELVVAARDLPDGEWTQHMPGVEIETLDGHWTPALGIGPDGHVFVCYNTRFSAPTWRRSANPEDVTSFGPEQNGMTGQNENDANYPEFTRLDDGREVRPIFDVIEGEPLPEDGVIKLGDDPGFGVDLNRDLIEPYGRA